MIGAIDEETGNVNSGFSGGAPQLGGALKAVSAALDFGRRQYGLIPGGQQAAAMPATPGTQSESGKRERPMPGPLPPTQNPFGKRAEATEAIDTEGDADEDDEEMA